ncbi:MAG: LysE family transporter [Muribaculaceae bacterium]|nr:LysE family transporter [Muribaculaceae bacterium]
MEMIPVIIIRGLLIGILVSAPMGPIGMLCIQRTLSKGRWPAFFTGLGAALSDLVYSMLTGLSLSFITDFITTNHIALQICGSIVFIIYAVYLYRIRPTRTIAAPNIPATTYWRDFVTGFLLTFSNPLIVFFIITLFARFNFLESGFVHYHYIAGYISILAGAVTWWLAVTTAVSMVRSRFNTQSLITLNRIIAIILMIIALLGIVSGINEYFENPMNLSLSIE